MEHLLDISHPVTWLVWLTGLLIVRYLYSDAYKLKQLQGDTAYKAEEGANIRADKDKELAANNTTLEDEQKLIFHKGVVNIDADARMKEKGHDTDEFIRKLKAELDAKLHEDRQTALHGLEIERIDLGQPQAVLDDLIRRYFATIDEYNALVVNPGPKGKKKLKALKWQIRKLEEEMYGEELGRASVQEEARPEFGRLEEDATESPRRPRTSREAVGE